MPIEYAEFLATWRNVLETMAEEGVDLTCMSVPTDYRFWTTDQDALNIAVMSTT